MVDVRLNNSSWLAAGATNSSILDVLALSHCAAIIVLRAPLACFVVYARNSPACCSGLPACHPLFSCMLIFSLLRPRLSVSFTSTCHAIPLACTSLPNSPEHARIAAPAVRPMMYLCNVHSAWAMTEAPPQLAGQA